MLHRASVGRPQMSAMAGLRCQGLPVRPAQSCKARELGQRCRVAAAPQQEQQVGWQGASDFLIRPGSAAVQA